MKSIQCTESYGYCIVLLAHNSWNGNYWGLFSRGNWWSYWILERNQESIVFFDSSHLRFSKLRWETENVKKFEMAGTVSQASSVKWSSNINVASYYMFHCASQSVVHLFSFLGYWCRFPGLFTLTPLFLSSVITSTSLFWIGMPECLLSEACFCSHCIHFFLELLCLAFHALLQSSFLQFLQVSYGMSFHYSRSFVSSPMKLRKHNCIVTLSNPIKAEFCLFCNIYLNRILCQD